MCSPFHLKLKQFQIYPRWVLSTFNWIKSNNLTVEWSNCNPLESFSLSSFHSSGNWFYSISTLPVSVCYVILYYVLVLLLQTGVKREGHIPFLAQAFAAAQLAIVEVELHSSAIYFSQRDNGRCDDDKYKNKSSKLENALNKYFSTEILFYIRSSTS